MKKRDLKKLAQMGITGGFLLAQTALSAGTSTSQLLASNGCGGRRSGSPIGSTGFEQGAYSSNLPGAPQETVTSGCQARSYPEYNQGMSTTAAPAYPSNFPGRSQGMVAGCQARSYPESTAAPTYPSNFPGRPQGMVAGCQARNPYPSNSEIGSQNVPTQPYSNRGFTSQGYFNQGNRTSVDNLNQSRENLPPMPQRMFPSREMNPSQTNSGLFNNPSSYNQGARQSIADAQTDMDSSTKKSSDMTEESPSTGTENVNKMSSEELRAQLNELGKATFDRLSPEGKALALKLANQDCKGKNDCKGLNSCKTKDNSCAGKGSCAGTSAAPFKDKNLAVKVAAIKMAEKRLGLNKNGSKY